MTLYYSLVSFSPSLCFVPGNLSVFGLQVQENIHKPAHAHTFVFGTKNVLDLLSGFTAPIVHSSSWPEYLLIKIAF